MPFREFTLQEKILSERRRADLPLFVTIWLGATAFSVAEGSWFYLLAATLAVGVNLAALRRAREAHVRRLFVNLAVICALGIMVVELTGRHANPVQAIGHFLILLQVCKLFEHKANRDYTQLLALSGLGLLAGSLLSNSIWFTLLMIPHLVLLCYTAMIFTLKRGLDAAGAAVLPGEAHPPDIRQIAWNVTRSWPGGTLRSRLTTILGAVAVGGVVIFLIVPRTATGPPQFLVNAAGAVTGFTPRIRLGETAGQVYQSNDVLMQVRIENPERGTLGQGTYLRGATFNFYHDSRWSNTGMPRDTSRLSPLPSPPRNLSDTIATAEISMVSSLLPNLFVPYPTVAGTSPSGWVYFMPDMTAEFGSQSAGQRVRYTVRCLSQPLSGEAREYLASMRSSFGAEMVDPASTVSTTAAVERLARQWCDDLLAQRNETNRDEMDLQIANRIAQQLQANYSYTLNLEAGSGDGVEDFLFRTRRGHCEYFASAMTVMCRLLGVQARLVSGFVLTEGSPAGGYLVRGRDAHAWTEVFTPSTDWVTIDATPAGGRETHGRVFLGSIRRFLNKLEFFWYDKVIGYDEATRRKVAQWLTDQWDTIRWAASRTMEAVRRSMHKLLVEGTVDLLLVELALALAAVALVLEGLLIFRALRRRTRRRREALGRLPVAPAEMKFMLAFFALLAKHGLRQQADQTPREMARRAAGKLGLPGEPLREIVELYYRARWGFLVPSPQEIRRAEQRVAELTDMLARR